MHKKHYIYLIPGFFGFADLGGITYFHHVRHLLENDYAEKGIDVEIHEIKTLPTASIRKRAGRLLQTIGDTALEDEAPIHLIGHSTGGLDARLFATPNAFLDVNSPYMLETFAKRVQTITTVATPHYGTPMANFFSSLLGEKLLYLLSVATIYTMQFGKMPMSIMIALGGILTKFDDYLGFKDTVLDGLYSKLFSDFDKERQETIRNFLQEIKNDRALVGQLTPGGIDLFSAACEDREGIRYGSVCMKARQPGVKAIQEIGLDPYRQSSHVVYRFLHWLAADSKAAYPMPTFQHESVMNEVYGEIPDHMQSDGVVPTLSQLWGELIHSGNGDHLDVCGHFNDFKNDPPHYDWIATGTSFNRAQFEALWHDVTRFIFNDE